MSCDGRHASVWSFLTLAIAALLAVVVYTRVPAAALPLVIEDDPGGSVQTYLDWYDRLQRAHVPIRIRGECTSACTLVLALPRSEVCVEPTAMFGFHLATDKDHPDGDIEVTKFLIKRFYPKAVQDWLADKVLTYKTITYMDAAQIVALKVFPYCASE